jgi:hypothetical protein
LKIAGLIIVFSKTLISWDWIGILTAIIMPLKEKARDGVKVEQMNFGRHASQGKNKRKTGRPTTYPDDPKLKRTVYIRQTILQKQPDNWNTSRFLEKCYMSSMDT